MVYFTASRDSPLERHLYVTSYAHLLSSSAPLEPAPIQRLTPLGFSHEVQLKVPVYPSAPSLEARPRGFFITVFSSITQPPAASLLTLAPLPPPLGPEPQSAWVDALALASLPLRGVRPCVFPYRAPLLVEVPAPTPTELPPNTEFELPSSQLHPTLYACVYLPPASDVLESNHPVPSASPPPSSSPSAAPSSSSSSSSSHSPSSSPVHVGGMGKRLFPTILHVYGGPHVQLVTNSYSVRLTFFFLPFCISAFFVWYSD